MKLIGRNPEISILTDLRKSTRPELIAVYGRRRVGKTFLVRNVCRNQICFEFSGMHNSSLKQQLHNFFLTLSAKKKGFSEPQSWLDAFHILGQYLDSLISDGKKVVFIDEFPWLDSRKSNFLPAFENFWNNYASKRDDLAVIICGSAASYMIKHVIKSKGGLHNRLTGKIQLKPFCLNETEQLLKSNGVRLTRYDMLQLYMVMGGIPNYLEKVLPGESVAQAVDRLCFAKNGFLRDEFKNIFASLFDQYENHETVIRKLSSVRKGLTRTEILAGTNLNSGGTLTKTLAELEESGFIERYLPFGQKSKDSLYRLTDEYSMFYLKYIEHTRPSESGVWNKLFSQPSYKIWSGFSFETICIKHIDQIKEGLKIAGIQSSQGSWKGMNMEYAAQIDLLIDRADNVINLCEIKFHQSEFTIDKAYADEIKRKTETFKDGTKTRKSLFVTFITTYGLIANEYSRQLVQNELMMDHLFAEL